MQSLINFSLIFEYKKMQTSAQVKQSQGFDFELGKSLNSNQRQNNSQLQLKMTSKSNFYQKQPKLFDNSIFQIFVLDFKQRSILFKVTKNHSIKRLKLKIQEKLKIPVEEQKISFAGKFLMNDKFIGDYGICQGSTLFFMIQLLGGLFSFNSLQKKIQKRFSTQGPLYRAVKFGLNLHAKCKNSACAAFNKKVVIPKGFGSFNISKQICNCKCPICQNVCPQATNFGYFKTHIKVLGRQKCGKNVKWQQRNEKQTYTTFQNKDQDLKEWIYLQVTTKPLDVQIQSLQFDNSSQDFEDLNQQA